MQALASMIVGYVFATREFSMKISKALSMLFWEKSASFDMVKIAMENMLVSKAAIGAVRIAATSWIAVVRVLRALSIVFLTSEKA